MYSTSIISIPFCRAHNITAISAHVIISCLSSAVVIYYPQNILVDVSEMPCPVPQPLGGAFSYPCGRSHIISLTVTP
uniref:Putative cellulose synthase A catalytic synthase, plant conserved region n=1 Tax=Siphoviridae sp. ctLsx2 TaxID=2826254 RepID=A0A8S5QU02_9CAUD|nr:MAG TPA: putative cellulose synthase A catalytic synthase, plant conserved region [Siphoviridae sp. ctLsx2]